MPRNDWNGNGKKDLFDDYIDMKLSSGDREVKNDDLFVSDNSFGLRNRRSNSSLDLDVFDDDFDDSFEDDGFEDWDDDYVYLDEPTRYDSSDELNDDSQDLEDNGIEYAYNYSSCDDANEYVYYNKDQYIRQQVM